MIKVDYNDTAVDAALRRISGALSDMTPLMTDLGEILLQSTKDRFNEGVAPDGTAWAAKSQVTIDRYAAKGDHADTRPLIGPSKSLSTQISYQADARSVSISSSLIYAAMMQFGGTKAQFPHLWGDIPARPFLGISASDRDNIVDAVEEWLEAVAAG